MWSPRVVGNMSERAPRRGESWRPQLLTWLRSIRVGHPVEMDAWLSMQKAPQNIRRLSSSSAGSSGGVSVGGRAFSSVVSRWWRPIIWTSRTHLAALSEARVNSMQRASYVAVKPHACA